MQPIQQAFEPVSICFASDDNYAPYLKVAIYSLLCNRNRERSYDIIILHKRISREHQGEILGLADGKSGVSIRFVNVVEADRWVLLCRRDELSSVAFFKAVSKLQADAVFRL